MSHPPYPILITLPLKNRVFLTLIALAPLIAGPFIAQRPGSLRFFVALPAPVVGWSIFVVGALLSLMALNAALRNIPSLRLDAEGLVWTPNWGGPRRLAWHDIAEFASSYDRYGGVRVTATDGSHIAILALDRRVDELRDLLETCHAVAVGRP